MTTIVLMILATSILFMFMNHPLTLGLILLTETLMISLLTGMLNYNFWFSYILFLIMVGGMLILFIYMTSVASNEKFKFSLKISSLISILLMFMLILLFIDQFTLQFNMLNSDLIQSKFNETNSINKYVNFPNNLIMVMAIIYLLITLIMVVKITNMKNGPLRQKY
nr:NADH dehydrogenase subunit 6 [Trichoferus campestris]